MKQQAIEVKNVKVPVTQGSGIVFGVVLGTGLGALFGNVALGIAIGIAVGIGLEGARLSYFDKSFLKRFKKA